MATQRADDSAAFEDFHDVLKRCTMRATCSRPYIRTSELTKWMMSKRSDHNTQVDHLLRWAYRKKNFQPVSSEQLCSRENCGLIVFCILLDLGCGELLERFLEHGIYDKKLPQDLQIRRMRLSEHEHLLKVFDEKQWSFFPAKLSLGMARSFDKEVIPISKKEIITEKGGTARLWQIEVLEDFVGTDLREAVKSSRYESPEDGLGYRYQFALKTFKASNQGLYRDEKSAFDGLRGHEGMVRFLGSYDYKEVRRAPDRSRVTGITSNEPLLETTYNIILEYGDLDLEDYFIARQPPALGTEVKAFWIDIFEIGDAVRGIHNLKTGEGELVQEYHGWHADIKPGNILSVHGKFKLADPGFARFVKKKSSDEIPTEFISGGTETYGSPEQLPVRRNTLSAVPQSIDVWSLGCVFSLAATWVVLGYQGILQFDHIRQKAIDRIVEQQRIQPVSDPNSTLTAGDYFQNGHDVLPEVRSWHNYLRSIIRRSDNFTSLVLDIVDQKMLLGTASSRLNAKDLCEELKIIFSQVQHTQQLPDIIKESLLDFDKGASSKSNPQPSSERNRRGKSKLIGPPPLKTTHRMEVFQSQIPNHQNEALSLAMSASKIPAKPLEHGRPLSLDSGLGSASPPNHQRLQDIEGQNQSNNSHQRLQYSHMNSSGVSSPVRPRKPRKTSSKTETPPPRNIFQARADIDKRSKGHLFGKNLQKDPLLSRYFTNRDLMFLVDNADTMGPFWDEATYLLETLIMKAAGQDDNGMELAFTLGNVRVKNEKKPERFKRAMADLNAMPQPGLNTDMRWSLGSIFQDYLQALEDSRRNRGFRTQGMKDLTIIVLTDGKWTGMNESNQNDSLNSKIVTFLKEIEETRNLKHRPVSIEFVQFGNDPDSTDRLQNLDDNLGGNFNEDNVSDVIDTEPSTGDVNKMLLGSFVDAYDNNDKRVYYDKEEDYDDNTSHADRTKQVTSLYGYDDMSNISSSSMNQPSILLNQSNPASPPAMDSFRSPTRNQNQQFLDSENHASLRRAGTNETFARQQQRPSEPSQYGGKANSNTSFYRNMRSRD